MKEKAITLPGRVTLQYVEQGDPGGLPVIFLHGVTDSWRSFELMLPHLPPSIHAFALTQRGHGDSERPMEGYRTRDFAGDVAAFADALDLGAIVVVGHSMGSTNAMGFASEYPQRTLGLVLAAAFFRYRLNAVIEEFTSEVLRLTDPIAPAFARDFQLGTLARPIPGWFLDQAVRESLKMPARIWRAVFEGFLDDEAAGGLSRIEAPTLLTWGDRDAFCSRADQDALLGAIRGSRLTVYSGAGHALHWEEPARFASDVAAFCASLAPRAATANAG